MHENYLQNNQLISVVNAINNMDDYFCYVRTSGQRPSMSLGSRPQSHNQIDNLRTSPRKRWTKGRKDFLIIIKKKINANWVHFLMSQDGKTQWIKLI